MTLNYGSRNAVAWKKTGLIMAETCQSKPLPNRPKPPQLFDSKFISCFSYKKEGRKIPAFFTAS
ncbi:hypothetical protein [Pseudochrobactrum lubricantis]|uniref:hypothetical protein n=1 Tax=Pseudochrobactrum lubricantis TaxID=558172 RepID=UPI0035D73F56